MGLIISDSWDRVKGYTFSDPDIVDHYEVPLIVRSSEGLRITFQLAVHYKVGISFDNKTKLAEEYRDIYTRYGDKDSWDKIVFQVTTAAAKDACQKFSAT